MSYFQGFMIQLIAYGLIWFWDAYIGFLICIVLPAILVALLIIAWIAEKIEPSRVPKSYFKWMILSTIPPLLVLGFFMFLDEGHFDFLK